MGLKNYQYDLIIRSYDSLRLKNKHDLAKREEIAYKAIPELSIIDSEMAEGSVKRAKAALMGSMDSLSSLEAENKRLSDKKKEALASHGFPSDYLDMRYRCRQCKDYGYIDNVKCRCFKQAVVDLIYSQSNVKSAVNMENFSTFSYAYYSSDYVEETTGMTPLNNIKKVVEYAGNFISTFNDSFQNLLILGNTGVGKTFLTNCIAKELLDAGTIVIYLTSFQFFQIMEEYKFNKSDELHAVLKDRFEYILDCDLLIIDDLGTEMNNTFVSSQLYHVVNERFLRRRSTIISTNLSFLQIKDNYSERTASRIMSGYKLLKIVGEDIRIKKLI